MRCCVLLKTLMTVSCGTPLEAPLLVHMQYAQAQGMAPGQRSFLFEYLCEHVPQSADEEAKAFVQSLPILPSFMELRRRPAHNALLCSQELLSSVVGEVTLLPETLLVRNHPCKVSRYTGHGTLSIPWSIVWP